MKYFTPILLFTFILTLASPSFASDDELGSFASEVSESFVQVSQVHGRAQIIMEDGRHDLKVGEKFSDNAYIQTRDHTLLVLLMPSYGLIYIGPQSTLKLKSISGSGADMSAQIEMMMGRVRFVNYQGHYEISSSDGLVSFSDADLSWDRFKVDGNTFNELIKFSGNVTSEDFNFESEETSKRPDRTDRNVATLERPWEKWLGKVDSIQKYDYELEPKFSRRGIASLGGRAMSEDELDAEFVDLTNSRGLASLDSDTDSEEEDYEYPEVKKEIYVHENLFDHVLMSIQNAAIEKARSIVPIAYRSAAEEIVWDVASHSVIRWGTQYAQMATVDNIPVNLQSMYQEMIRRDVSYDQKDLYVESIIRISEVKSYTTAKTTVEKQGMLKAKEDAMKYLIEVVPTIIQAPVEKRIYDHAKEAGKTAAQEFMKQSELMITDDVDVLVEHLSQLAAKKYTKLITKEYETKVAGFVAERASQEAAKNGSDRIARFISSRIAARTGQLFKKMIDQEVATRAARSLASENQESLGRQYQVQKNLESR